MGVRLRIQTLFPLFRTSLSISFLPQLTFETVFQIAGG